MTVTADLPADLMLHVEQDIEINAPITTAFQSLLEILGPKCTAPGGEAMPMILEARPGGRWFRDLGNDTGHLWGHVQVIKPPTILEIIGPLFMSYPVASHVRYELSETGEESTHVALVHRALGLIDAQHRAGVGPGWRHFLERIKQNSER